MMKRKRRKWKMTRRTKTMSRSRTGLNTRKTLPSLTRNEDLPSNILSFLINNIPILKYTGFI